MKKWFRYLLGTLLCTFLWGMTVCAEGADKGVIALGADLSAESGAAAGAAGFGGIPHRPGKNPFPGPADAL